MSDKKYEILKDQAITMNGSSIYRIRALKDFGDVKAGDLGGFVASEENLSHEGPCWIYGDAMVYHKAKVKENAIVRDYVHVYGNVFDHARVNGFAIVQDNATVSENTRVYGETIVKDYAMVSGHMMVAQGTISNSVILFGIGEINFDVSEKDDWTFYRNPCVNSGFITTSTKIDVWNYRFFTGTAEEFIDMFERVEDHHRIPGELEFMKALVKFHRDLYFKA